jgi:hypothetical protein
MMQLKQQNAKDTHVPEILEDLVCSSIYRQLRKCIFVDARIWRRGRCELESSLNLASIDVALL